MTHTDNQADSAIKGNGEETAAAPATREEPAAVTPPSTTGTTRWDADIPLPAARSNRPVKFIHRIEFALAKGLLSILRAQPIDKAASRLGRLMRGLGPMIVSTHNLGHRNLALVYPDMTPAERAAILRDVWSNLGAVAAEFAHLEKLGDRVTILNPEKLEPYKDGNDNAIFFSGHFANWEAMAITLHRIGVRFAVVYRAANNPLVDDMIIKRRGEVMSRWQVPKGKRGAKDLLKALQQNLSLCMLADQKFNEGLATPFLGHEGMTATAAARLALREGKPLIPLQLIRRPGSRFTLKVHDPVTIEETGDIGKDTELLCAAMNDSISRFIRERPDQWLWLHRRWPRKLVS